MEKSAVDRKTLAWIKEGVDETLQFVESALTEFTENTDDPTPIKICIGALHRVKGAVQMVGIEGAKILASEMEMLACALVDGKIKQKDEAAEVLAAGMYQLTGYLESLYHGHADMPLVLLPILNDCRVCQERPLYSEGEFFSPNLEIDPPQKKAQRCAVSGDVSVAAKKLRPGYLAGLLGVIKSDNVSHNFKQLIFVLDNLGIVSTNEKARQLWWITRGIVESLLHEDLPLSISIKILLGRVDHEIQRVITIGEQVIADERPVKILKSLLYYIAQSQSQCSNVLAIKKAFHLSGSNEAEVSKSRESLYGFNVGLVESVSEQLGEELATIKDELDITKHSKAGSTEGLDDVLKNFTIVADILNMLGMVKQKDVINKQKDFLAEKISQLATLNDNEMMGIATALLYVESSIGDLAGVINDTNDDRGMSPAEFENLLKLVAQELLEIIQQIKHSVDEYSLGEPSDISVLGNVPELLKQLASTMKTINDNQQSELADAINQYVCQELIINENEIDVTSLDLLADAITGLENYYQAQLEESVAPELGLQVAAQSITQLGFPPESNEVVLEYVA